MKEVPTFLSVWKAALINKDNEYSALKKMFVIANKTCFSFIPDPYHYNYKELHYAFS